MPDTKETLLKAVSELRDVANRLNVRCFDMTAAKVYAVADSLESLANAPAVPQQTPGEWVLPPFDGRRNLPEQNYVIEYQYHTTNPVSHFYRYIGEWDMVGIDKWRYVTAPLVAAPAVPQKSKDMYDLENDHWSGKYRELYAAVRGIPDAAIGKVTKEGHEGVVEYAKKIGTAAAPAVPQIDDRERAAKVCEASAIKASGLWEVPVSLREVAAEIRKLPPLAECPKCADGEKVLAEVRAENDELKTRNVELRSDNTGYACHVSELKNELARLKSPDKTPDAVPELSGDSNSIVDQLRAQAQFLETWSIKIDGEDMPGIQLLNDAADEIERLQKLQFKTPDAVPGQRSVTAFVTFNFAGDPICVTWNPMPPIGVPSHGHIPCTVTWTDPPVPEIKPEPPIDWSTEPAGPRMDEAVSKIRGISQPRSYSTDRGWALSAIKGMDMTETEILRQPGETIALRACRAILEREQRKGGE